MYLYTIPQHPLLSLISPAPIADLIVIYFLTKQYTLCPKHGTKKKEKRKDNRTKKKKPKEKPETNRRQTDDGVGEPEQQ